eukprot:14918110-Alexandrium_andersonii.AAC.1
MATHGQSDPPTHPSACASNAILITSTQARHVCVQRAFPPSHRTFSGGNRTESPVGGRGAGAELRAHALPAARACQPESARE